MKKWAMAALCVLFSLMFCFNCLGYAALSATLTIEGSATWTMPEEVIITDAVFSSSTGGGASTQAPAYMNTTLTTGVNLGSNSGTVTFQVTVFNNTDEVQGYDATTAISEAYSNANIAYELTDLVRPTVTTNNSTGETTVTEGTKINPGESHTFYITFAFDENASATDNKLLTSSLKFNFKPYDSIQPDENFVIIEGALGRFLEILNDPTAYAGLDSELKDGMVLTNSPGDIFDWLLQTAVKLLLQGAEEYDYPTVGNVGDSFLSEDSGDVDYVTGLFEDSETGEEFLTLQINGETVNVKALIQGVDSDADGDYDIMMLYMTPTAIKGTDKTVTPVYLAFFQYNDTQSRWYQVGDLYTGSAGACRYSTSKDQSGQWSGSLQNNSFNPDTWVSDTGVTRDALLEQVKAGTLS